MTKLRTITIRWRYDDDDPSLRQVQGKLGSGQARLPAWRRGDEVIRQRGIAIDYSHHHHSVFSWKGQMVENHMWKRNLVASEPLVPRMLRLAWSHVVKPETMANFDRFKVNLPHQPRKT